MMKMTTCCAIVLVAGFAMIKLIDIQIDERLSFPSVISQDKRVRELSVNYFAFKRPFEDTLCALREGDVSLAEAVARVNDVAARYNPDYFEHIVLAERGKSREECTARNLVGHLTSLPSREPMAYSRVSELKVELAAYLQDLGKSSAAQCESREPE